MKLYWVELIRNKEEHAWIEVEADNEQHAKDKAVSESDSFDIDWVEDFSDVWATEVEEKTEEGI